MCIRTVMTYASPVFAHAAQKHYIDYRRFFDIAGSHPNALLRAAVDYQPPHPLSVGHETYLPIHLTLLQRQLKVMTSTTRMTDLGGLSVSQVIDLSSLLHPAAANRLRPGREKEPTRDGFLRHLCRDDFHQASSMAMSRAVGTRMCRPAALGETIKVV
ncbi:hypothetical protein EVAR_87696_1 [Eumeta japonica]|uniref:Uncharacterized protein n=1 Tax=Eumeta variegata TaxID=151549 RepID=A0A4C1TC33_EUMVA|nr:hypothetical protein EVAR_87696_1 [Eumeta japonica]